MAEVNNDHSDELRDTDIMDAPKADVDMEMTGYDGLPAFFEKYGLMSKNGLKTAVDLCVKNEVEVEHLRILKQEGDSLTVKLKTYLPDANAPCIDSIAEAVSAYQSQRGGTKDAG